MVFGVRFDFRLDSVSDAGGGLMHGVEVAEVVPEVSAR